MRFEQRTVEFVARLAPWLAPAPSAYFIADAAISHLAVPPVIGVVIAAVIESLGVSTIHTALRLYDWNQSSLTAAGNLKRGRSLAPRRVIWLAVGMIAVYLVATVSLTVVLEVRPALATYAPAIFPLLAIVGGTNLAVRANQARREETSVPERSRGRSLARGTSGSGRSGERSNGRSDGAQTAVQAGRSPSGALDGASSRLGVLNAQRRLTRDQKLERLVEFLDEDPERGPTELARLLNVRSRTTVYNYLNDLEAAGRIRRNGDRPIEVVR